jgi:hypothetical protein
LLLKQGSRVRRFRREVLRTSGKSIRLDTVFARSPGTDIIKLGKEFALADLLTCKLLYCYKVLEVTVVCEYSNQDSSALEFSSL